MTTTARRDTPVYEMARACFDLGDDDEVIITIRAALPSLTDPQERFKAYLLMACSEWRKGWVKQSLQTLSKAAPLFDKMPPKLKGRYHGQRAVVHSRLKKRDAALMDLEAAKFWAEQAGDEEEIAIARNNLSKQYSDAGRFEEAITEVDAAIGFARACSDNRLLGQFYDMKAQILVKQERFEEALEFSEKAMFLLESHPTVTEARETHGRALIGLGASYLVQDDPVATVKARRSAAELIPTHVDKEVIQLALERSNGNVLGAAEDLGVYHSHLLKVSRKYNLPHETRRGAKPLVKKS